MTETRKTIGPDGKVTITEITKSRTLGLGLTVVWNMIKLVFWLGVFLFFLGLLLV